MPLSFADILAQCRASQSRFERAIANLTDEQARASSGLPGWTRGHVITHVARSADGVNRLARSVLDGLDTEMYPGGPDARAGGIEEGADRPVELLRLDTAFAGRRALDSLAELSAEQQAAPVKWRKPITAGELPLLRWRELEIHLLDLELGYGSADWPDEFVAFNLERELNALPDRAPGVDSPVLPDHELLAWLVGRLKGAGLPDLPAWP